MEPWLHGTCEAEAELETHQLMYNKHLQAKIYDVSYDLPVLSAAGAWLSTGVDWMSLGCTGAVRQGRS